MPILRKIQLPRPSNNHLAKFARNVASQCGEDGIVETLFKKIPQASLSRWCVEFGAWDGKHLSNSFHPITNLGWSGVLIEADTAKFAELTQTHAKNDKVYCINEMVTLEPHQQLDALLARTPIPSDFDFLSIDIDGLDWHVWSSLSNYFPRVVVIEFNPTIPNDVIYVQDPDIRVRQGSSLCAIVEMARAKGYELVCTVPWNAFFVRREFFSLFGIADNSIELMHNPSPNVTSMFQLFDGTIVTCGLQKLLWHDRRFGPLDLQVLSESERTYGASPRV